MSVSGRCPWCGDDPLYVAYHDQEWGVPCHDPREMWEALVLESFQSGLSWITILRRREGFRAAFQGFRPEVIATWGEPEILALLQDTRIIRHRGKIEATIAAAQAYLRIEARMGFARFIWSFVDGKVVQNQLTGMATALAQTSQSTALAKALKSEGFKFLGATTTYAFMQAVGMVNDHLTSCPRHAELGGKTR